MLSLDVLQAGSNPLIKTISDLVHGSYGWLQNLAFALVAFWFFLFVSRLYFLTKRKISSLTGTSLLSVTSIGFALIAIFPSQIGGLEQALQGLVHDSIAGIICSSFIIGCTAFAVHFKKDPQWQRYWLYTALTAVFCLAFALLWALMPREWQLEGLGERLLLICGLIWVAVISLKLVRLCRQSRKQSETNCNIGLPT